jgi:hypothetical protein
MQPRHAPSLHAQLTAPAVAMCQSPPLLPPVTQIKPEAETGLARVSTTPYRRGGSTVGAPQHFIAAGATPSVASPLPLRRLSVTGRAPATPKEGRRGGGGSAGGGDGGEGGRRGQGKGADEGDIELPV